MDYKVQYMDDMDPFTCTGLLRPVLRPTFVFDPSLPLISQLPSIHQLLNAPHLLEDSGKQEYFPKFRLIA